jgi:ketosteroid isomerase-like protein
MRSEFMGKLMFLFAVLCSSACWAQNKAIDPDARKQIDAGNQQWVDAMEQGNAALLAPGNAEGAVDCSSKGHCIEGRPALERQAKEQLATLGKADAASVVSVGSVQQGRYVYEWGEARAHFPSGKSIVDRYLTVWQKQMDGTWKIFRNLVMPTS